jgi:hypothetical protein
MPEAAPEKDWTRVAFGDVVRQVRDRVDPDESGLERYVAGEHMDTDDLRIRRWGQIGDGYLGPAFHMRFKPGHVLYGSRRTYLRKVAVADFEGITANTTFVIESKDPTVLLPELLNLARDVVAAEKTLPPINEDDRGKAALTELFREVRNEDTPIMVERVVNDIDEIVRIVRFDGWQSTHAGEREVRNALRKTLFKYKLHQDQDLFDRAYGYVRTYY